MRRKQRSSATVLSCFRWLHSGKLAAPRNTDSRISAELVRHRPALTAVLTRLGHVFAKQFPMSWCPLRVLGRRPRARPRTFGFVVFLSWFSNEHRSMNAKLSAHNLLQGFFTAAIDEDFQGAALLDAALPNEETCEQKRGRPTCSHVQELQRSVVAQSCRSANCTVACVNLVGLMIVCFYCQTACQRFLEAVAEQVNAGLPERKLSSEPLDSEGSAPRRGTQVACGRGSQASAHERNLRAGLWVQLARSSSMASVCVSDSTRTCPVICGHRIVSSSLAQASSYAPTMPLDWRSGGD